MQKNQKSKTVGIINIPTLEKKLQELKSQLRAAEKKYKEAQLSIGDKNHISFHIGNEADYFLNVEGIELIDTACVISKLSGKSGKNLSDFHRAQIYGFLRNTSYGRYQSIFIKVNYDVWRCNNLKTAYEMIEKIKPLTDYSWLADKLSSKFYDLKFKIEELKNKNKVKPLAKKTPLHKAA
ncbi:MAG: hypothetical protein WKF85_04170 [Chitinophagaceae bacterium]